MKKKRIDEVWIMEKNAPLVRGSERERSKNMKYLWENNCNNNAPPPHMYCFFDASFFSTQMP